MITTYEDKDMILVRAERGDGTMVAVPVILGKPDDWWDGD